MTYYTIKCGKGFDLIDETGRSFCYSNYYTSKMNITVSKTEFSLSDLDKIKDHRMFSSDRDNIDRKAFIKSAVEWYIKERLCIELDSGTLLEHHIS